MRPPRRARFAIERACQRRMCRKSWGAREGRSALHRTPRELGKEQQELYERRDYHQPSDTYPESPASWDLSGAVEDARLQLWIGLRVGNQPALPVWRKGDEFERARLNAPR